MSVAVAILGGGITGLSAASFLLDESPEMDLVVLESENRPGGNIGSERVEGLVLERGPNGLVATAPHGLDLARKLGLGDRLIASSPRAARRFIYRARGGGGRLYPVGPLEVLTSRFLSLRGRLRLLGEPFARRKDPDVEESVAAFGRRRLGKELTALVLDPLVTGIFGGDVERLSMDAAFPRVARMEREHGSLFRALLAARRARRSGAPSATADPTSAPASARTLWSFPDGLEELIAALRRRVGDRLRLGALVERVAPKDGGYEVVLRSGETLSADSVLCTLPPPRAARVLRGASPELASALEEIPCAPIAVSCLAFRREDVEHPLDGLGFLAPRGEGLRTLGAIFTSSLFPAHAPEGTVSIRALVGGALDPTIVEAPEESIHGLVLSELRPILGISGEPRLRRLHRYPLGIPQYTLGHGRRVERIESALGSSPGLFVAGNAYRGVGINDSIADALRAAREILGGLRSRAEPR